MSTQEMHKPMKLAEFHVLLVLAAEDRHGLGVAKAVDEATEGAVRLGPGTLYRSLKELTASGLVEPTSAPDGEDDPRRFLRLQAARVESDRQVGGGRLQVSRIRGRRRDDRDQRLSGR